MPRMDALSFLSDSAFDDEELIEEAVRSRFCTGCANPFEKYDARKFRITMRSHALTATQKAQQPKLS